jgi:hypothetical protein
MVRLCGIRFKLLPELQYLVIDGARRGIGVISPYFVQKLFAAQNPLGIFNEILQ